MCRAVRQRERGFALVSTLWIVGLLSIIAISVSANMQSNLKVTRNYLDALQAEQLAKAGIQLAIFDLLENRQGRKPISLSRSYVLSAGRVDIQLRDEAGKVDLNTASKNLLETIIGSASETEDHTTEIVEAILDWRDADSNARANGAEQASYTSSEASKSIKNGKFEFVDELGHVTGISQEMFRKINPDLTVSSAKRGIDPRHASDKLIDLIVGENELLSQQFKENRDTNNTRTNIALLRKAGVSRRLFSSPTRSSFTIEAKARTHTGAERTMETSVMISRNSFEIKSW